MKEKTNLPMSAGISQAPEINWEKQHVPPDVFARCFREAVDAIEAAGIHYALIGGIASSLLGRPRHTQDADFFVKPSDAEATLDALESAGRSGSSAPRTWS